jgi:16S rRNA (cytidine1402-2'-O)-methyltransferase
MSDFARDQTEPGRDRSPTDRQRRGTLFVVATPIGNLEDITLRALRVLREVAVVAAEDTRRTINLLRHYDIDTPLVSLHEHNERRRGEQLLQRLQHGQSVALVSDAGTPGISDPGAAFIRLARDAGIRVDVVPGPSAVTAALSASGVSFDRYAFAGFPPIKANARIAWFNWVARLRDLPVVAFEAPHRIDRTLREARSLLVNRPIIVARELTKAHEDWSVIRPASPATAQQETVSTKLAPDIPARGEFVLIICPETTPATAPDPPTDRQIVDEFWRMTNNASGTRRAAVKAVATRLGLPPKVVYAALERVKNTSQT